MSTDNRSESSLINSAANNDLDITTATEGGTQCPQHNLPLNFWQEKEQCYACIKCLIDEEEVHYVDTSFKERLARFKQIRALTEKMVLNNNAMPHTIADWKDDIRDMVLRVREQLIQFID